MAREPFCVALLVRNELARFLPEVLDHHGQWGPLLVLDDGSTDGTYEYCRDHPAVRWCERLDAAGMWGRESPARQRLWELAAEYAEWHLVADADQLFSADPRPLIKTDALNAWCFPLYDCWNDRGTYRDDSFWRGHLHPRPWLLNPHRTHPHYVARWSGRGVHCGHLPENFPLVAQVAPSEFYWLHLAYLTPEARVKKLHQYRGTFNQMTEFEKAHAESIVDPNPSLRVLPFNKPIRILVGGPVRKRADILAAHLQSLESQELPKRVQVSYCFVEDYPTADPAQDMLAAFVREHEGPVLLKSSQTNNTDFADNHPVTHQWTVSAMQRVAQLKNAILKVAVDGQFDYVWLCDSDLICDPTTLASLLSAQKAVVSAVYWTKWNTDPKLAAAPQVWQRPPYQLGLPHYPEAKFREDLASRKLVKVGGLGACTLIRRDVIEKGVHFGKPPDFPSGGLMDGEDRHFCEWARRLHVDLYADGWPDIFHVYNLNTDAGSTMDRMAHRLSQRHPDFPNQTHQVSLKLHNLEIPHYGAFHVRCTLGDGTLSPELEMHVMSMKRGEDKIAKLHFPSTTPMLPGIQPLAGNALTVQIEVVDCKPSGFAPTLEDEFCQRMDLTRYTETQQASMAVEASS